MEFDIFEKYILDRIKEIFKIPFMYGTTNESVELQVITLLEVWFFGIKNFKSEIENRYILTIYQQKIKENFPKIGNILLSQYLKDRKEFNLIFEKIINEIIIQIKEQKDSL